MTDDELVERCPFCGVPATSRVFLDHGYCYGNCDACGATGPVLPFQGFGIRPDLVEAAKAKALAAFCRPAAVREAVLKRVRVCGKCDGSGGIVNGVHLMPCDTCRGRGVTESET